MASRKPIFTVTYHDDDDTGMYEIGDIDCGLGDELTNFAKAYGTEKLIDYLQNVLPKRIIDFVEYQKTYEKNSI